MALHEMAAWGPFCPWPMEEGHEGPIVDLPPTTTFFCTAPKKVTTYRTCPNCGNRGTKIVSLSSTDPDRYIFCQCCRHHYAPPLLRSGVRAGSYRLIVTGRLHEYK